MTKSNQLFEAIGNIDDDIAANAIKAAQQRKRKKPITLLAMTAAAAVLSLIVGFASQGGDYDRFFVEFETNHSPKRGFTTTITEHHYTIPGEFDTLRDKDGRLAGSLDMLPSEIFEKFGLTMLTSENFTETKDKKIRYVDDGEVISAYAPYIYGEKQHMEINYSLYDENVGIYIRVESTYIADMDKYILLGLGDFHFADENADIVTLNDGSLAMVSDTTAAFCYDGAGFILEFDYYKNEKATIDNMKQVLADLGIYTIGQ